MLKKLEEIGSFTEKCGKKRIKVPLPIQEEIGTDIVEFFVTSEVVLRARTFARDLYIPCAIARKILKNVIQFYPHKISRHQQLLPSDSKQTLNFSLTLLVRLNVNDAFP